MDGHCALTVVGDAAWYRWSALKAAAASSAGLCLRIMGAMRDVRALDIPQLLEFTGVEDVAMEFPSCLTADLSRCRSVERRFIAVLYFAL
jgi:hypothetical protein